MSDTPALLNLLDAPEGSDSAFFISAFAECSGTLLTGQTRKDGFIDYWIMPPQDPLNLAFVTLLFCLLQKLALLGTRNNKGGFALVFRLCA